MQAPKFTCEKCGHLAVCKIYPNIDSLTKQMFPADAPPAFAAYEVANICRAYISQALVKMNLEAETQNTFQP